jgi:hypothetical protein
VAAELCDPVAEVAAGAEEEGEDALGVTAGAFETEGEEEKGEDALGVTAGALETEGEEEEGDDALGVTAGALETEGEEGEDTLGVGAVRVDGARVTVGASVTDALGDPAVYVTFLTTPRPKSLK